MNIENICLFQSQIWLACTVLSNMIWTCWWKSNLLTGEFVLWLICYKMWFTPGEASFNLQSSEAFFVPPSGAPYGTTCQWWPAMFNFHSVPVTAQNLHHYQCKWEQLTQTYLMKERYNRFLTWTGSLRKRKELQGRQIIFCKASLCWIIAMHGSEQSRPTY